MSDSIASMPLSMILDAVNMSPRYGPCCPPLRPEGQSSVSTKDQSLNAGEFVRINSVLRGFRLEEVVPFVMFLMVLI